MGRKLKQAVPAQVIAAALGLRLAQADGAMVSAVGSAQEGGVGVLSFAKNAEWASRAHMDCILITDAESACTRVGPSLVSNEPRLDFARCLAFLERSSGFVWDGVDAQVHPTARLGRNVVLGRGVYVGEDTVIGHNVVIGDEVKLGKRCLIKSGAVIGEEGFGFERDADGVAVRLPHIGGVLIGDDVEIGSLTTVCRGTLADTIIRDGAKIDDHVHIAHNVFVDSHAFVIACAEVSGGVRVGAGSWIAPNATVMNQVTIGANAVVGLGAVVLKSVADGAVVVGNPAKPLSK